MEGCKKDAIMLHKFLGCYNTVFCSSNGDMVYTASDPFLAASKLHIVQRRFRNLSQYGVHVVLQNGMDPGHGGL